MLGFDEEEAFDGVGAQAEGFEEGDFEGWGVVLDGFRFVVIDLAAEHQYKHKSH
jgi:hypothetical protein